MFETVPAYNCFKSSVINSDSSKGYFSLYSLFVDLNIFLKTVSISAGDVFNFAVYVDLMWSRCFVNTGTDELRVMAKEMRTRISMLSTKLVKQLKRRDKHAYKLQRNFDVLTAILQAVSLKRRK